MATPTTLPASFTAGEVLTAAQMNGVRGAFRILQSLFTWTGTSVSNATSTYSTTNLALAITPQSTSSRIKIQASIQMYNDATSGEIGLRIVKTIGGVTTTVLTNTQARAGASLVSQVPITWYDDPATTSAITYTIQFARTNGTGTITAQIGNQASTIILEEISA
jgi:hypothetical protein